LPHFWLRPTLGRNRLCFRLRIRRLCLVLASWWTAASRLPDDFVHPGRRTAASRTSSPRQSFQTKDCFLDLLSLGFQFGENFADIHLQGLPSGDHALLRSRSVPNRSSIHL